MIILHVAVHKILTHNIYTKVINKPANYFNINVSNAIHHYMNKIMCIV